jgi:hypothetical protein
LKKTTPSKKSYVWGLKFRFQLLYIIGGCH